MPGVSRNLTVEGGGREGLQGRMERKNVLEECRAQKGPYIHFVLHWSFFEVPKKKIK
jgi:hypothetical protein